MYTAVKEIGHLLSMHDLHHEGAEKSGKSALQVVVLIVLMNLIFSFDSVLSALAITDVFPVLAAAILLSGAAMLLLADGVTAFIEKNRMYEVLGLFILLIVGVVLLGEAGVAAEHATHDPSMGIHIFGYALIPMSKTTFYFAVVVLFVVEFIQTGYKRKLDAERARGAQAETVPVHDSTH
jgi:predicted tellurium resistance membrane protein TerC